ncbi:hypothetical protein IAD21_04664 [Abditibacteriota bacterium]|nr:hypothetical protein IAD21_04664 [Abditibacteriota bacterium]
MLSQFPALHANWQEELAGNRRAIIFCWASWSPPDFMFSPVLARVVPDLKECAFFTADLDEGDLVPFLLEAEVMTNPHVLLWENGTVRERIIGFMKEENLRGLFAEWGVL